MQTLASGATLGTPVLEALSAVTAAGVKLTVVVSASDTCGSLR